MISKATGYIQVKEFWFPRIGDRIERLFHIAAAIGIIRIEGS